MNLEEIYKSLSINEIYDFSNIIQKSKQIEEFDSSLYEEMQNIFVPQNIRNFFIKCQNKTVIHIPKYELTMNLYYLDKLDLSMSQLFQTIKKIIVTRKFFKIKGNIVIHFVCCPFKRYFPTHGIVSSEHINGGFTDISKNEIFITRIEEYPKVLLHEVLHHCQSIHGSFTKNNTEMLKHVFNISEETVLIPNEAVVEFWASILLMKFLSFETHIPFETLYAIELKHSMNQSARIIKKQGTKKWKEKSNAFCYIIFKTILLANVCEFLKGYTFPYDDSYVTIFLIKHQNLIQQSTSNLRIDKESFRMMLLSD